MKNFCNLIKNLLKLIKIYFRDKLKYNLANEALNGYSFDFGYLYYIEYAKLAQMKNYFEKYGYTTRANEIAKQIDLAMKLLDIIKNDDNLFEYAEDKTSTGKTWLERHKYKSNVNVNLKNAKRFAKNTYDIEKYNNWPHELYLEKAKCLYHKIRNMYEQTWWD